MPQAVIGAGLLYLGGTAAVFIGQALLINYTLGLIGKALAPKGPRTVEAPINVTVKSSIENRRIISGRRRAGGSLVFYDVSSSTGSTNDTLWYVIVYAGHQCCAMTDMWIDSERIPDADISAGTGAVSTSKFSGKLNIWKHLGTSTQAVDSNIDAAFAAWTSNFKLLGCAYAVIKFQRSDSAYPNGAPQSVTALMDGHAVYDSRLDTTNGGSGSQRSTNPSTWTVTYPGIANPALIWRWRMTGGSVTHDITTRHIMYGLREADSRILDAYTAAAANECDESISGANAPPSGAQTRYECDLETTTAQTHREILEDVLATMAGTMLCVGGKYRVFAGAYDSPLHTLTEIDLYGDVFEVQDTSTAKERKNKYSAVYIDDSSQYVEATTLYRTDSAYVTQDGGIERPDEINLKGCTNQYRAQRLAEIELRRSRMMRVIKIRGRNLMRIAPNETFTLSHTRFGWSNRVFRCIDRQLEVEADQVLVVITAKREDSGVWTDMVTADYTTGTSATDVYTNDAPDAPTSLTITAFPNAIKFVVGLPAFVGDGTQVEIWEYTASTPFASATRVFSGSVTDTIYISKKDTTTRYYWSRLVFRTGAAGATFPASTGSAGAAESGVGTLVTDEPADGSILFAGATQPVIEAAGIDGLISFTAPATSAIKVIASCQAQANIDVTTSGTAVGYSLMRMAVTINAVLVFDKNVRIEGFISSTDTWATLSISMPFDVPAGQQIDVYLNTGRSFSTGGLSPAQNHYWRGATMSITPMTP